MSIYHYHHVKKMIYITLSGYWRNLTGMSDRRSIATGAKTQFEYVALLCMVCFRPFSLENGSYFVILLIWF